MIKVGTKVFVRPSKSLVFAGRWGEVTNIDMTEGLPFTVKFNADNTEYKFFGDEIMSDETYYSWFNLGDTVQSRVNGSRSIITGLDFPIIRTNDSSNYHFTNLLPVHTCKGCGTIKAGIFNQECDNCLDGGLLDGEN